MNDARESENAACEQQRRRPGCADRPDCASAQPDKRLCYLLYEY